MSNVTGSILRNVHIRCSSPQFVVEQLDAVMNVLGYDRLRSADVVRDSSLSIESFLVSMLTGGWVSLYNDDLFLLEEVTRRLSFHCAAPCFYLWAEEGAAWGYSYYNNGSLRDEFCSAIDDLYEALFSSPPSDTERSKLLGSPTDLLAELTVRTVSPDYVSKLFRIDRQYAKGCMVKFAQIFGIQTAGRTFDSIWGLPDEEKFGKERFSFVRYLSRGVDGDDDETGQQELRTDDVPAQPPR